MAADFIEVLLGGKDDGGVTFVGWKESKVPLFRPEGIHSSSWLDLILSGVFSVLWL